MSTTILITTTQFYSTTNTPFTATATVTYINASSTVSLTASIDTSISSFSTTESSNVDFALALDNPKLSVSASTAITHSTSASNIRIIAGTVILKLYGERSTSDSSVQIVTAKAEIPSIDTKVTITPTKLTTTASQTFNGLSYTLSVKDIAGSDVTLSGTAYKEVISPASSSSSPPTTTALVITTTVFHTGSTSTITSFYSTPVVISTSSTTIPNNYAESTQWWLEYTVTDQYGITYKTTTHSYYVTTGYSSNFKFTILHNNTPLNAPFNIKCERSIYSASELDFSLTPKDMVLTTTSGLDQYSIAIGDEVSFWYLGNLVFTGNIQNITKHNNNTYDLVAYDSLYYLTALRVSMNLGSDDASSTVLFGNMITNILSDSGKSVSVPSTTNPGFGYKLNTGISIYFPLMQLSSLFGLKFAATNTNGLVLTKVYSTSTTKLVENSNNYVPNRNNDVNYGYNNVTVTANEFTGSGGVITTTVRASTTSVTEQVTNKQLSYMWLYVNSDAEWSNLPLTTTSKPATVETLSELGLNLLSSFNQQGYSEVNLWFNLKGYPANTTNGISQSSILNLGVPNNFTVTFSDKSVWENLFISKYTIDQTGLKLKLVNMHQDLWSMMNSITATSTST